MRQRWSRIVWAHWAVEPDAVAALLPPDLSPDTFNDSAWIGLVPFQMSDLRLPGEVNVRTYVRGPDGRTGVWFVTLDADRRLAVAAARLAFGLPYRQATTRFVATSEGGSERLEWTSARRRDGARAELAVAPEPRPPRVAAPGLEHFLVERYVLYSQWHGRLLRGSLSHAPWRVRGAALLDVHAGTLTADGIHVEGTPHVLVGESVEVEVHTFSRLRLTRTDEAGFAAAGQGPVEVRE
jgi:hypothetical protein